MFAERSPSLKAHSIHGSSSTAAIWCGAFLATLILYAATANRGEQWQDSGAQQYRFVTGQFDHPLGLALCHPVQYWLARAAIQAPGLSPALAITLISALASAVAVANLTATIRLLTGSTLATAISVAALALSHTFWQHATHTEVYALVSALLTGEWLCLTAFATTGKARYLLLSAFLNGLGLGAHMLATLATPVIIAVFVWAVHSKKCTLRTAVAGALLWVMGTAPYSALVVMRIFQTGDAGGVLHSAIFGTFASSVLNTSVSLRSILMPVGYVAYNFPGLTVPLALVGVWAAMRKRDGLTWIRRVLIAELLIYAAFVFRYSVPDQYAFFFPVYLILAVFAAIGLAHTADSLSRRPSRLVIAAAAITAVWTPVVYLGAVSVMRSRGVLKTMVGNKPYRDGYRSFFVPWGVGDDHGARLNDEVRSLAGQQGLVLLPYNMIGVGVRFAHAVGRLPESIELRDASKAESDSAVAEWRAELAAALKAARPVVLVPKDRDHPEDFVPNLKWERHGDLYVLKAIEPTSPP